MSGRDTTVCTHQPLSKAISNGKTVIRKAADVDAKLGKSITPMRMGTPTTSLPFRQSETSNARSAMRTTRLTLVGRAGFSSTDGQIGFAPTRRGVAVSLGRTACARHKRRLSVRSGWGKRLRAWSVRTRQTVGRTARLSRQHSSVVHQTDGNQ